MSWQAKTLGGRALSAPGENGRRAQSRTSSSNVFSKSVIGEKRKKGPESDYPDVVQKSFDVLPENFPVGRAIIVTGLVSYQFTPAGCLIERLAVGIGDDGIIK